LDGKGLTEGNYLGRRYDETAIFSDLCSFFVSNPLNFSRKGTKEAK
jgi:hypothetical protein